MKQVGRIATIELAVACTYLFVASFLIPQILPFFDPETGQLFTRIFFLLGLLATLICAWYPISRWVNSHPPKKLTPPTSVTMIGAEDLVEGYNGDCPVSQSRPWVRYCARCIDIIIATVCLGAIPSFTPLVSSPDWIISRMLLLFFWCLCEALCLSTWGTTPGKSLMRVTVRNADGSKLNVRSALSRSVDVWIRGLGAGVPLIGLIALIVAYEKLTQNGITTWDQSRNFAVSHNRIGRVRVVITILLLAGVVFLVVPLIIIAHSKKG